MAMATTMFTGSAELSFSSIPEFNLSMIQANFSFSASEPSSPERGDSIVAGTSQLILPLALATNEPEEFLNNAMEAMKKFEVEKTAIDRVSSLRPRLNAPPRTIAPQPLLSKRKPAPKREKRTKIKNDSKTENRRSTRIKMTRPSPPIKYKAEPKQRTTKNSLKAGAEFLL